MGTPTDHAHSTWGLVASLTQHEQVFKGSELVVHHDGHVAMRAMQAGSRSLQLMMAVSVGQSATGRPPPLPRRATAYQLSQQVGGPPT